MKKLLILFLFFVIKLDAQVYYVGSPIYDTLIFTPGSAGYSPTGCPRFVVTFDSSMTQNPSGTQVYFKIISATMATNSLNELTNGILNVGDSFAVTPTNCSFQFYSSVNAWASFNFAFLRTGIPAIQGDSFTCKDDIHEALSTWVDGCGSIIERNFLVGGIGVDSCAVQGPMYSNEIDLAKNVISFIPNPTSSSCKIDLPSTTDKIFTIEIVDVMGRIVKTEKVDPTLNERNAVVDLSELANGVYSVRVTGEHAMFTGRVVRQ